MTEADWQRAFAEIGPGAEIAMRAQTGLAGNLRLRHEAGTCVARWELDLIAVEAIGRPRRDDGDGFFAARAAVARAVNVVVSVAGDSPAFKAARRVQ